MIKNFNVKRGDQFSFTITFSNLTADLTTMNFGVKKGMKFLAAYYQKVAKQF